MTIHYRICLDIDPPGQHLSAHVDLTYSPPEPVPALEFLLHRDLDVATITGPLVARFTRRPQGHTYAPEAVTWVVDLCTPAAAGTQVSLGFTYSGRLLTPLPDGWQVNRLTKSWVELGMYGPWFPWMPAGGPFTYRLRLGVDEPYQVAGMGRILRSGGEWSVDCARPVEDMTIVAAPELHRITRSAAGAGLTVHYTTAGDASVAGAVADDCLRVLHYYSGWLGESGSPGDLAIVIAPRHRGGGYARPGLIVMQAITAPAGESKDFTGYVAHELAHLWWYGAPVTTWEDWLNESFAEYCALKAVSVLRGDQLRQLVDKRRPAIVGLPPITNLDRRHEKAYDVLYTKGAVLLYDLEQMVGEAAFTEVLRRRLATGVNTTDGLLAVLDSVAGQEAVTWLNRGLDSGE